MVLQKTLNLWPSELAVKQIAKRLKTNNFPYYYEHLSCDYGGYTFIYNKRLNVLYIFVQDIQLFAVSEQRRLLPKICIYIV